MTDQPQNKSAEAAAESNAPQTAPPENPAHTSTPKPDSAPDTNADAATESKVDADAAAQATAEEATPVATEQQAAPPTPVDPEAKKKAEAAAKQRAEQEAEQARKLAEKRAAEQTKRQQQQQALNKEVDAALGDQSVADLMNEGTSSMAPPVAEPTPQQAAAAKAAEQGDDAKPGEAAAEPAPPSNTRRGKIAGVRGDDVFVELGPKEQGVCATSAFKGKVPRVGEYVDFFIETFLEDEQLYKLALPGTAAKADWKTLQKGMIVEGMVIGMNTGGLEVKIAGQRGFMPMSHVDVNRIEDFSPFLNKKIKCKVLELDKRKKRMLVSRRAVLEQEAKEERKKLAQSIQADEVREGVVRRLEQFGAFVELVPGVDGLLHVSDLAHHRVAHPKDILEIGQKVTVKVLKVQKGGQRISLGLKQLTDSPWKKADEKYVAGETVKGTVTRTMQFGAFVELEPGVEGLIHISQLSDKRVDRVEQVAQVGKEVEAKITEVDPKRQRIGLSIRALLVPEEEQRPEEASRDEIRKYTKSADQAKAMESLMSKFGDGGGLKGGIG